MFPGHQRWGGDPQKTQRNAKSKKKTPQKHKQTKKTLITCKLLQEPPGIIAFLAENFTSSRIFFFIMQPYLPCNAVHVLDRLFPHGILVSEKKSGPNAEFIQIEKKTAGRNLKKSPGKNQKGKFAKNAKQKKWKKSVVEFPVYLLGWDIGHLAAKFPSQEKSSLDLCINEITADKSSIEHNIERQG